MRSATGSIGAGILLTIALGGSSPEALALGFGRNANNSHLGQALDFSVLLHFDGGEFVSSECVVAEVIAGEDRVPPANVRISIEAPRESGDRLLRVRTSSVIEEPIVSVNLSVGCPAILTKKYVAFIDPPTLNLAQSPTLENTAAPVIAPLPPIAPRREPAIRVATPSAPARPAASASEAASAPPRRPRPTRTAVRPPSRDLTLATAPDAAARPAPRASETVVRAAAAPRGGGPRLQLEAPPPLPPVAAASAAAPAAAPASAAPLAKSAASSAATVAAAPAASGAAKAAASAAPPLATAMPASGAAEAVAAQASAALAATTPATAAAASQAAGNAPADAQAVRLHALEDNLAKLRAESEATRGTVATLQSRLREAEAARDSNHPLTNWLLGLVALLLLALAGMVVWMRRRERERDAWWAASIQQGTVAQAGAPLAAAADIVPSEYGIEPPQAAAVSTQVAAPAVIETPPRTEPSGPVAWKPTRAIPELGTSDVAHRTFSADELIDLEQQVEFFVTLGQDEAAVDLLNDHIQSAAGVSPLPSLKLMEIHRRRGDRAAYERVRADFNPRFHASAPGWDEHDAPSRPLEDNADVIAQLQETWSTPPRAMGLLELLLFRAGSKPAFDLEAYRDVLFLYEIARDLSGHVDDRVLVVDFELPLLTTPASSVLVTPSLRATQPVKPKPEVVRPMKVDLDLDLGI